MIEQYNDILTTIWIVLSVIVALGGLYRVLKEEYKQGLWIIIGSPVLGFTILVSLPIWLVLVSLNIIAVGVNEAFKG